MLPLAQPWSFTSGGPTLRGQLFSAAQPKAAVLVLHGYAEHSGRYAGIIEALTAQHYSVYTYDQRGHGQSAGARAVVDTADLVADHLRAREALRAQPLPVFAFGHSLGGLITAASALRDPRGLSGVVLSSPALRVGQDESALLKAVSGLLGRWLPALPVVALSSAHLSRVEGVAAAYDNDPQVHAGKVPALTAASMLKLSAALQTQWPHWRLPALVLHGSADKLADVRGSRDFAASAGIGVTPRPEIEYLEIEGGYHELFNDTVRGEVTQRTLAWLRAHTPT